MGRVVLIGFAFTYCLLDPVSLVLAADAGISPKGKIESLHDHVNRVGDSQECVHYLLDYDVDPAN